MKVHVPLTQKVLLSMVLIVILLSVIVGTILLRQSDTQSSRQYHEIQLRNQARYGLLVELLSNRLTVWMEASEYFRGGQFSSPEEMAASMQRTQAFLQLHWEVSDIWLLSASGKTLYGNTATLPPLANVWAKRTSEKLRPFSTISCQLQCKQILTVPFIDINGDVSVAVVTSSMQELLALLSESSQARLALVAKVPSPASGKPDLVLNSKLTPKLQRFMNSVISALPEDVPFGDMISSGVRVNIDDTPYLATLLPLEEMDNQGNFILFAHDISASVYDANMNKILIVIGAGGLIIVFGISLFFILQGFSHKLVRLSEILPLLAQQRFVEFKEHRQSIITRTSVFSDELDTLDSAAVELAERLEHLDNEVEAHTAKLQKMAMFDSLTGLPNRNMLTFQIDKKLAEMKREETSVALMFIDLDDFKKVNDSHGHSIGDELLKLAALRLSRPIRESDLAARFGGDEFVILLTNVTETSQVELVAEKLINEFTTPLKVGEISFYMTISIGISMTNTAQTTSVELLRHADTAMYEAKASQGSAYQMYDASMNLKVMRKVELESEARVALLQDQFFLALQPQVELRTGRLIGFEALLRWRHPTRGLIPPADFIPLLENTPFMLQLDYWVVSRAIRLLKELNQNGYSDIKMAINLSAGQFLDRSLCDYLQLQIDKHDVSASAIELEITETMLVSDLSRGTQVMEELRCIGFQLAADDFGTGYSSLSYLKSMPVDVVKIDRSFVAGMLESSNDRNIVYSTISMVRSMGRRVVAEGIENAAQYELLAHFDCHVGQGYFICRPINEDNIWDVLEQSVVDGVWSTNLPVFNPEKTAAELHL